MYKLIKHDLSGLGGPMGTEVIRTEWEKYFNKIDNAKLFAEKDFSKRNATDLDDITWKYQSTNIIWSGDLRFCSYEIHLIYAED